jgi:predicted DNA-binding transcriptional regulator AlpA
MLLNKQQTSILPHLVGAAAIAVSIDMSVKHIYKLAASGQLPHYRWHGSVRFDPKKIAQWLESHEIAA